MITSIKDTHMAINLTGADLHIGNSETAGAAPNRGTFAMLSLLARSFADALRAEHTFNDALAHGATRGDAARATYEALFGERKAR